MFFDEPGPERTSQKPRLRLAGLDEPRDLSARDRLNAAKVRREPDGPSLLDRIDAYRREQQESAIEAAPEPKQSPNTPANDEYSDDNRFAQSAMPRHEYPTGGDHSVHWSVQQPAASGHGPLVDPLYVIDAVRRLKYLIAATTILGGVIGTGVALNTPKLYASAAQIIIDPRNNKVIENDINPDVFLSEAALAIVDSQVGIIRSPVIMDKVAQKLGLDKDAEFNGAKQGVLAAAMKLVGLSASNSDDGSRMGTAIRNLNEHADIDRQAGTFIVNINIKSEDAQKAALIANTVVDVYMEERAQGRSDTAGKAADALGSRLPELKKQVEVAENAVASFKTENDLFDTQGRQIDDDSVVRLNEQLNAARINTVNLNAKAATAKGLTVDAVASGDLPEEIGSNTLGTLRGRYTQALQRIEGLQAKLGPMHPDLQQAQGEAASLKTSIDQEIRRIRSSIQTELKRAVQTEQQLAANLAQMKAKLSQSAGPLVKLRDLERTAASARQVYEQFLLRAQETSEQASIDSTNVTKTNPAKPADESEGSSRKVIMLGGFIGGFLFGLGLAILKGMWDALAIQYGSRMRARPANPSPVSPAPDAPLAPGGKGRGFLRGSFQPTSNAVHAPVMSPANVAEDKTPAIAASAQQTSHTMYPYPPMMPTPYPPVQGWAQPAQQPMMPYGAPMPQQMMQPQMMQPQMMATMPMWYPQPQFPAHPQQFMPQPVVVHNYPAPVQQPAPAPVTVRHEEPAPSAPAPVPVAPKIAPRPVRPLPTNADIDDIREQLADMRAELMDLARQRRRA